MNTMNTNEAMLENQQTDNLKQTDKSSGYSFYQKLFFLYFLNLIDWICTEVLIASGKFYEANPLMQSVLTGFWITIFVKGILPLILVIGCAVIFKVTNSKQSFMTNLLLYIGIIAYACVNLWHIFNFVLLFS